jgi:protease-4
MVEAINYSKAKGKPVVALADLAASAAYWVASACDMIIASNDISSEFGSIGVMISFADMAPYYEKEGVKVHTVYAPESTHKNLPLENAMKGDYALLQDEVLSPLAKQFQKTVKKNRSGKLDDKAEGILNGKMFYSDQALKNGLIDKIGNLEFAVKQAKRLSVAYQFNNNPKS